METKLSFQQNSRGGKNHLSVSTVIGIRYRKRQQHKRPLKNASSRKNYGRSNQNLGGKTQRIRYKHQEHACAILMYASGGSIIVHFSFPVYTNGTQPLPSQRISRKLKEKQIGWYTSFNQTV